MLNEQRKIQLDGIIHQMIDNRESDKNIQFVVDDFKKKYEYENEDKQISDSSFLKRLQLSFGSKKEQAQKREPRGFLKGGLKEIPSDIADVAGKALPLGGMLLGGTLGAPGGLLGVVAGAGVGAGLGEKIRQDIGTKLGVQDVSSKEKLGEIGKEALSGAGAEVGGRFIGLVAKPVISKVIKPTVKKVSEVIKNAVAIMTSVPEKAIEKALVSPAVKQGFDRGVNATTIREEAVNLYNSVRKQMGQEFDEGLNALKAKFKTGISFYPNIQLTKQINDATSGIPSIFRKFRVAVINKGTTLDFNKLNSAIVKKGEQSNLQAVYDTIRNQKDYSVSGIQAVAARINALIKYTEGVQTQSSAIIGKMHNLYDKAIQKSFPELGILRKQYSVTSQMLKNTDDIINATKNNNIKSIRAGVAKLTNIFREDNDIYINSLMALEKASGGEFLSKLAGTEFQRITPGLLRTSLAVGGLAQLTKSATALLLLPLFSPRFWGGTLVKVAQSKLILNDIFKNYMGINVLDSATKVLINQIILGRLGEKEEK